MSELSELDPIHAPIMTKKQCNKRMSALQPTIDAGWELVEFMNKLDAAMRLAFLNYCYTYPVAELTLEPSDALLGIIPQEPLPEGEGSGRKEHSKTLAPKKRKKRAKKPATV